MMNKPKEPAWLYISRVIKRDYLGGQTAKNG